MRQLVRLKTGAIAALSLVLVAGMPLMAHAEDEPMLKPRQTRPKPPDPKPGDRLEAYMARYKGLHETGGIAVKGLAPGFAFRIWEGLKGKEASVSETFLPCDPTETGGLVYLPKLSLMVMTTPEHERYVIGDSKADQFFGPEPIDKFVAANEAQAITRIPPAPNIWALLQRTWDRLVKREPRYKQVVMDDRYKAYLAQLDGGAIESLLFVPNWEKALPEEIPASAKPGGIMRRFDYLAEYRKIALDDLYPFVFKDTKKKHH